MSPTFPGTHPSALYRPALGLLTDLYQLSMGQGYHREGMAEREAAFHLFFRKPPFKGGYAVAAGLADALDYLTHLRFDEEDIAFLASLQGNDGRPLFDAAYLRRLREHSCAVSVDAIPEGTPVFAHEPLLRVSGPLLEVQLVETALLCILNFQTLIATKASRVVHAAGDRPVLEFGLRRAQGFDGALSASRAAYVGGCAATSNVLAGRLLGIPVRGTHAHSWVMAFPDELSAFQAYADALPNNCTFLVDTYDTVEGVRHAIEVGRQLRARGHALAGIRLDSGDLAALSQEARQMLDEAGFPDAKIVASNDLDERLIESLGHQGAKVDIWGVGTKLITAYDQAALGGVYKLGAIRDEAGVWRPRIKLSEQPVKISNPGLLGVRRYQDASGRMVADMIHDIQDQAPDPAFLVDIDDPLRHRRLPPGLSARELLVPRLRDGRRVSEDPPLVEIRAATLAGLQTLEPGVLRFDNPAATAVGLEPGLAARKRVLIEEARTI